MADKQIILGLKKMRVPGATRRDEWNRPNRKAAARLAMRLKDYEKMGKTRDDGFCKPGSMKCY
jgi:hypothetical protein